MTMIHEIHKNAKTARWIGILLIITGIIALIAPFAAGLSVALLVGSMLLVGGIGYIFLTFRAGSFGAGLGSFLLGIFSTLTGLYMLAQPAAALAALTLVLAAYFIASGIMESVSAFSAKGTAGWGWLLFNGIVSVILGLMIWGQFPLSGAWAVGILVGLRLFLTGWTLLVIGGAAGRLTNTAGR